MDATLPKFTSPRRCFVDTTYHEEEELPMPALYQTNSTATAPTMPTLQNHKDRWMHMSALAGDHRQDDATVRLNRPIPPQAFKAGLPPQVAARVERLHICMSINSLPEWLDVLASSCFALEHLHMNQQLEHNEEDGDNDTDDAARRMRRLYILYRLPDLISIDGELVTDQERALARPNTPNGQKVNRNEWVDGGDGSDDAAMKEAVILQQKGEIVEVTLDGLIFKPVPADPPQESFDEAELVMHKQRRVPVTFEEERQSSPSISAENRATTAQQQYPQDSGTSTKERPSPAQSPALLMSEVSEDDASPSPTNNNYLTRFHAMHTLCSRSEKYLPMEESEPLLLKAAPHRSRTTLSFRKASNSSSSNHNMLLFNPNFKPQEGKPLPNRNNATSTSNNNNATMGTPERRIASTTASPSQHKANFAKTPPRLMLTPTHSPGASPSFRSLSYHGSNNTNNTMSPSTGLLTSPGTGAASSLPVRSLRGNNVTMSPGASLTSPFPMQFRSRVNNTNKKMTAKATMVDPNNSTATMTTPTPMKSFSLQEQVDDAIKNKETINDVVMTVPSSPISKTLAASRQTATTKNMVTNTNGSRPPPCPGRIVAAASPHDERRKRVLGRWRNRTQLRSNPMMDKDDDDGDEEDDDHELHTAQ